MLFDLSDIIKKPETHEKLELFIDAKDADFMGEQYKFIEPIHLLGTIGNNSKNLEISAEATAKMQTRCAKCAKEIEVDIKFPVTEILVKGEDNIDNPDVIVYEGHEVDITEIVLNSFFMNVEGRYLCREDCKGLCPVCGCDRNETECTCDTEVIDPRWSKLAEIMKDTTT